ncbi:MAG: hypothetical protein UT24_C0033G0019 [Candidatus Woesebacteria bacterium GW2011_GWB1_39_12]|uniref:Uncharacterized protein n=1 Tax=Candidatus Woesebacteria bacterium GW2011_GWB1_39_12 TaxID=1618574 RepID=A0A0G0PL58_9BACT|nr:MAG: hypothetical protein UT24_C0033G0019 [Candidatus Woesebacteria bacterium GW2011_GWB1_39_12]
MNLEEALTLLPKEAERMELISVAFRIISLTEIYLHEKNNLLS